MILRFRSIKQPGCTCPCPPYLHVEIKWNSVRKYYGGPICFCEIFNLLETTSEEEIDTEILKRVQTYDDVITVQAARLANTIDRKILNQLLECQIAPEV